MLRSTYKSEQVGKWRRDIEELLHWEWENFNIVNLQKDMLDLSLCFAPVQLNWFSAELYKH